MSKCCHHKFVNVEICFEDIVTEMFLRCQKIFNVVMSISEMLECRFRNCRFVSLCLKMLSLSVARGCTANMSGVTDWMMSEVVIRWSQVVES